MGNSNNCPGNEFPEGLHDERELEKMNTGMVTVLSSTDTILFLKSNANVPCHVLRSFNFSRDELSLKKKKKYLQEGCRDCSQRGEIKRQIERLTVLMVFTKKNCNEFSLY